MHPLMVAAQFLAYGWFLRQKGPGAEEEAARFAKRSWLLFLPHAHEGLGKLLLRVAEARAQSARRIPLRLGARGGVPNDNPDRPADKPENRPHNPGQPRTPPAGLPRTRP
jgi:hypothetical protein